MRCRLQCHCTRRCHQYLLQLALVAVEIVVVAAMFSFRAVTTAYSIALVGIADHSLFLFVYIPLTQASIGWHCRLSTLGSSYTHLVGIAASPWRLFGYYGYVRNESLSR